MGTIRLELDDGLVEAIQRVGNGKPVTQTARELIVLELYRQQVISAGRASELLNLPLLEFIRASGHGGIPFFRLSEEETDAEVRASREL